MCVCCRSWPRELAAEGYTDDCVVLIHATNASSGHRDDSAVNEARWGCYTMAFFNALSQMLSIGYGLVNPVRTPEVWLVIVSMFSGTAMYAVALSFAVSAFSNVDHPSRMYKNSLEVLNEFMRVRTLPSELRARLRSYFLSMYPNRRIFNERSVIGEFSYSLRGEIRMAMCERLFQNTPIFATADGALLSAISPHLLNEITMPGDYLAQVTTLT